MSVQILWDNDDKTIIRQMYEGVVTQEDYYAAMIRTVDHTVHSIYHRRQITAHPTTMVAILRYGHRHMPPNLGVRVIVGATQFTRVMVNIGTAIAPNLVKNVFFAETLEQAHQIIAAQIAAQEAANSAPVT